MRSLLFRFLFCLILIALVPHTGSIANAGCDQCPTRMVTLFDFDVSVPRPDSTGDLGKWYDLFFASSGAGAVIFSPECSDFKDASFYRDTTGVPSKSFSLGIDHPFTAPAGNMKGMDYLVSGTVQPDGSGYLLTMKLETACDRVTVVSASTHFDDAAQASDKGRELATQKFIPIATIIRDFERKVRTENTDVSIAGYNANMVIDPSKRKAAINEKVPVTITLTDCDGEPLAGRKISLTGNGDKMAKPSTNGTWAATEAITGSNGSVTVDFTVGAAKRPALVRAYFFHKTPFGCKAVGMDESAISVAGSAEFYQIRYKYEEKRKMELNADEQPMPTWTKVSRKSSSIRFEFSGSAVVENSSYGVGAGLIDITGSALDSGTTNGSYRESIHTFYNENYSDASSSIRNGNFEDRITTGEPSLETGTLPDYYMSYNPKDLAAAQFYISVPFKLNGSLFGQGFQQISGSGKTFDTSWTNTGTDSITTPFTTAGAITYTNTDSIVFLISSRDSSWTSAGIQNRLSVALTATVAPIATRVSKLAMNFNPASALSTSRIRVLNNGALIVCNLRNIVPQEQVHVELYTLSGKRVAVLHDSQRGAIGSESLSLSTRKIRTGTGLFVVAFRSGNIHQSKVLFFKGNAQNR